MKKCEVCGSTQGKIYGKKGDYGMDLCCRHRHQMQRHGKILERTIKDPNEFIITNDIVEVVMYDKYCCESGRAITNLEYYDTINKYKWHISAQGYAVAFIDGKWCTMHRLITNAPIGTDVDHINHKGLDNRSENLRICQHQQNMCNLKKSVRNSSGISGISWDKSRNKWLVQLTINGKRILCKRFKMKQDAIDARKKAEDEFFGKFANKAI